MILILASKKRSPPFSEQGFFSAKFFERDSSLKFRDDEWARLNVDQIPSSLLARGPELLPHLVSSPRPGTCGLERTLIILFCP